MEFFIYCRDRAGSGRIRRQLSEAHWSYMDPYRDRLIARGPTISPDQAEITGSLHIIDLPDADAATRYVEDEPFYRAGAYASVVMRRWRNALGRTMSEFAGITAEANRFLVIGEARAGQVPDAPDDCGELVARGHAGALIACGPLLSRDGKRWLGVGLLLEAGDRGRAEALVAQTPAARRGLLGRVEVHAWRPGGRPAS